MPPAPVTPPLPVFAPSPAAPPSPNVPPSLAPAAPVTPPWPNVPAPPDVPPRPKVPTKPIPRPGVTVLPPHTMGRPECAQIEPAPMFWHMSVTHSSLPAQAAPTGVVPARLQVLVNRSHAVGLAHLSVHGAPSIGGDPQVPMPSLWLGTHARS